MSTNVLFVCEHSAGKSLLAATYFRAAAVRLGIDASTEIAGPDPDPVNMPTVEAALVAQGYSIGWTPKLISTAHTDGADRVVSLGCDASLIPTDGPVVVWDVPLLSADFDASVMLIHDHAEAFAAEIAAQTKRRPD